jgi:diadenosine tetraphosphate (Ap4A) HIT family hydrolase
MAQSADASVNCVFCGILAGDVPASFVYDDELTSAFLDIRPVARGHVLVVPRRHRLRLEDLDEREGVAMWNAARRIAKAAQGGLHASGANLLLADGRSAGQEVDHLHLHVIPRYRLDDLVFDARAWALPAPERDELMDTASALTAALAEEVDR